MNEATYLKCSCKQCGNHIEFPETAAGRVVDCPHCGKATVLSAGPPRAAQVRGVAEKPATRSAVRTILLFVIPALTLALAAGGLLFAKHLKMQVAPAPSAKLPEMATNPAVQLATQAVAQVAAKPAKSLEDLKVGEIQLEKTKGTGLVYAVGKLKNDSDYQRFGVKIELDLFNQKGAKVGTAQDQISILEPRQEWPFHALITDSKAVSAKLASVKEED